MAAFNLSIPKVQLQIEEAWDDAMQRADYMAKVSALTGQLSRQTARVSPVITGSGQNAKKITKTIIWPTICTNTVSDCSDECAVSSSEASDSSIDITLSLCKSVDFKESYKRFRSSNLDFENVVARQFLTKMKALDEALTNAYIAFVAASKGTHEYSLAVGANSSGDWQIPAVDWSVDLIPEFMLSAEFSRFTNPYLLDGLNFWTQSVRASANQPNDNGKGDANLFSVFPLVSDPVNMSVTAPAKTYLVNASAIALVTGNFWDTRPTTFAGDHRMWKQPSRNLPGVMYDVHEVTACSSDDFVVSYRISANYGFFLNPVGCTAGRKGVLSYEKV